MSLDKSLKGKSSMARHRNVLTRPERIARLKTFNLWADDKSPFAMPKVGNRKPSIGKKASKKGPEEAAAADKKAPAAAGGKKK